MNKKSQFELIGLAIVVLLVILGMFIAIKLQSLKQPERVEVEYGQTQLASNFLNTLVSTNTKDDCAFRLVRELLVDCADLQAIECVADGEIVDSCTKAEQIIDQILGETLKVWEKKYLLTIKTGGSSIIPDKSSDCTLAMEREMPGIYYYSLEHGGTLTVRLDLCY